MTETEKKIHDVILADIAVEMSEYAELFEISPDRWEAVNYCIGRYGCVNKDHITVINALVRTGKIKR